MLDDRKEFLRQIEKLYDAKALLYVTGDRQGLATQISGDTYDHFVDHLDNIGVVRRMCFILYSRGGETLAAWSLINLIRLYCDELVVLIPSRAHSAATLMALGANRLIMTKQATLGPIDPSVNGPLNPHIPGHPPTAKAPVSVEAINGFLKLVKDQNIKKEPQLSQIILSLCQHIHPLVLGDVFRTSSQIRMLAKRLISNQVTDPKKIEAIMEFMCSESGSHDYTINRREAKDELGLNVQTPSPDEYKIIKSLYDDFSAELQLTIPFDARHYLGQDTEKDYLFKRGLIESVGHSPHAFVTEGKLTQQQPQGQAGPQIQDFPSFEGWRYNNAQ